MIHVSCSFQAVFVVYILFLTPVNRWPVPSKTTHQDPHRCHRPKVNLDLPSWHVLGGSAVSDRFVHGDRSITMEIFHEIFPKKCADRKLGVAPNRSLYDEIFGTPSQPFSSVHSSLPLAPAKFPPRNHSPSTINLYWYTPGGVSRSNTNSPVSAFFTSGFDTPQKALNLDKQSIIPNPRNPLDICTFGCLAGHFIELLLWCFHLIIPIPGLIKNQDECWWKILFQNFLIRGEERF